jgi:hypothetical protein
MMGGAFNGIRRYSPLALTVALVLLRSRLACSAVGNMYCIKSLVELIKVTFNAESIGDVWAVNIFPYVIVAGTAVFVAMNAFMVTKVFTHATPSLSLSLLFAQGSRVWLQAHKEYDAGS